MTVTNICTIILHLVYTPPPPHAPKLLRTPGPSPKDSVPRWSGPDSPHLTRRAAGSWERYRHRAKALQSIQLELKPQTLLLLLYPSKFPRSLGMPRLQRVTVVPWLPEQERKGTERH